MANPSGNPGNLRRLPKGVSGNPGGRPKGTSITAALRRELDLIADGEAITKREKIAHKLVEMAMDGDLAAIREVLDRTEGKAVARQETGDAGAFEELEGKTTEELRAMLEVLK